MYSAVTSEEWVIGTEIILHTFGAFASESSYDPVRIELTPFADVFSVLYRLGIEILANDVIALVAEQSSATTIELHLCVFGDFHDHLNSACAGDTRRTAAR